MLPSFGEKNHTFREMDLWTYTDVSHLPASGVVIEHRISFVGGNAKKKKVLDEKSCSHKFKAGQADIYQGGLSE